MFVDSTSRLQRPYGVQIFASESDVLFLCGKYNKDTCGYSSLIPFTFNLLTFAAAERSREK